MIDVICMIILGVAVGALAILFGNLFIDLCGNVKLIEAEFEIIIDFLDDLQRGKTEPKASAEDILGGIKEGKGLPPLHDKRGEK